MQVLKIYKQAVLIMFRNLIALTTVGLIFAGVSSNAFAQDKKAKDYISEASPYLYLSCEGLVETFGEDDKKMEEVVKSMVAVSFINRQINAAKVLPEKSDQAAFGEFLEKALKAQCKDDVHSLMVANVDRAVAYAFAAEPDEKAK